jgi:hypothetical protein
MKFNNASTMRILALVFLIVIVYWLMGGSSSSQDASGSGGKWKVLGSMSCGYTRKQLDYMKAKKIPFEYKECQGGKCPGVEAFPTLVSPTGEKVVGYTEM